MQQVSGVKLALDFGSAALVDLDEAAIVKPTPAAAANPKSRLLCILAIFLLSIQATLGDRGHASPSRVSGP